MKLAFTIYGEPFTRVTYIYALLGAEGEVRYVGKSDRPYRRFEIHLCERRDTHKARWIRSMRDSGLRPTLRILEVARFDNWQERERHWIAHFEALGAVLTNSTKGGAGPLEPSEETRRKMSARRLGIKLSAETRRRMSESRTGKPSPKSKEAIANIAKFNESRRGVPLTHDHKAKLAEANRQRKTLAASGIRGVYFDRSRGKYQAWVKADRKMIHLGRYATADEASAAVREYAL